MEEEELNLEDFGDFDDLSEAETIDGTLTFDEILEDDYYNAEFEKRVQQRLEDIKNNSTGGQQPMDEQVQTPEGENKQGEVIEQTPAPTDNPTVENTDTAQQGATDDANESTHEMTGEQFDTYNETLRRISKTAKASLPERYNAFEDAEVKTQVKQLVMKGEKPNIKEIAASVVTRLTHKDEPTPTPSSEKQATADNTLLELKAENALLKAGISTERLDAAKRLFIAEGASFDNVAEFVAKYPEWHAQQEGGVVFSKAQPLTGKTAATPSGQPVLNDFEARVQALRKARGYK